MKSFHERPTRLFRSLNTSGGRDVIKLEWRECDEWYVDN